MPVSLLTAINYWVFPTRAIQDNYNPNVLIKPFSFFRNCHNVSLCHCPKTRLNIQIHCFTNVLIQWLYRFSQSFLDSRVRNKARRLSLTGYFLWVTTHQLCLSLTRLLLPSLCRQPWCSMASPQGSAANSHVDSCQWQLVNLSSPFCHFRAPALTFRKRCLCPSKLGAPDGGGHESLPFVQTHNYPGEIKTTPCCDNTHARN